jgi:protocatechuate 3,4-dioxygenase beta subunit
VTTADEPVADRVARVLDACVATCQLLAEQEEGPYRRGRQPPRRDVTEDRDGLALRLGLRLRTPDGEPVAAAEVEIWHCDAAGRYSGYPPFDPAATVDATPQVAVYRPDETFLRGRQVTDKDGDVEFRTIYPGWYSGRTVHVHLLVQVPGRSYITQLYFPEDVTAAVFAHTPYRDHSLPDTTHASDGIFATGGEPALLAIREDGDGRLGVICLVLPRL